MGFTAMLMISAILPVFAAQQTPPDRHSLYYVYTALSKPINAPGIFEFTAMGLLDDRKIDYYNSEDKVKVPEQDWMKRKLPADYWEKGTQSRRSKEQWFKVNVNILMERMRQNGSDVHVLMWKHGCEADQMPDGSFQFYRGVDAYSYDGNDFLSFDDNSMQWVAPVTAAVPTKQKWDGVPILNQYTKGYLEKECVDWLNKFRDYGDEELKQQMEFSPPVVTLFATPMTTCTDKLKLTCMATGFYPKDIYMSILEGDNVVLKDDASKVMPNGDGTHQIKLTVEVKRAEIDAYRCKLNHIALDKEIYRVWPSDGILCEPESSSIGIVVGVIVALILIIIAIAVAIVVKKCVLGKKPGSPGGTPNGSALARSKDPLLNMEGSPVVRLLAKESTSPDKVNLTCRATGSFPKHTDITILKGEKPVLKGDISNVTSNGDGTRQVKLSVEAKRSELGAYRCEVNHEGLGDKIQTVWPSAPPVVRLFAQDTTSPETVNLICMATGFYPKDIDITILKGGKLVLMGDISNVTSNGDGTHQMKLSLEAKRSELGVYRCEVNHKGLEDKIKRLWPSAPPVVNLTTETTSPETVNLTCMATDFYPKDIDITILKGEKKVLKGDICNVTSNGDGTHQIKLSVEAKKSELGDYSCEVNHKSLEQRMQTVWPLAPPVVRLVAKRTSPDKVNLTCMATGSFPKHTDITILKGEKPVMKGDISNVTSNGDGTRQVKLSVEAKRSELGDYRCEVNHDGLKDKITKVCTSVIEDSDSGKGSTTNGTPNDSLPGSSQGSQQSITLDIDAAAGEPPEEAHLLDNGAGSPEKITS